MPRTDATNRWREDLDVVDQELEAFQRAVDEARSSDRWHDADVIEPEFENLLAALAPRRTFDDSGWLAEPAGPNRKNSWREVLEEVG